MSSETSTEPAAFQPWHFFVIATMIAATAAVLVARETALPNLVLVSAAVMATGLVAFALYRTLWPLAASEEIISAPTVGGRTRLALQREKALVLRSIKELEFDRAMGKIADADFSEMVGRLRARAVGLMQQLDEAQPEWRAHIQQELERRLAGRRGIASTAARPAAVATAATCPDCGARNDADARFCKSCGTRLTDGH